MHALPQAELPAMVIRIRLPIHGESRTHNSVRIQRRQAIQNQPAREAFWARPRIARNFHV
jgi:hypothetical protein